MKAGIGRRGLLRHALLLAGAAKIPTSATARFTSMATPGGKLSREFRDPPDGARPRVWWHWMNGNITKEGIDADLAWMKRVGIAGIQTFDGSLDTPQVVETRLPYMSEGWKDAFRHAVAKAEAQGLEFTIASAPGWSETGGPWLKPGSAMKKLVWSELDVTGGLVDAARVPLPPTTTGPFQDIPGGGADPAKPYSGPPLPTFYRDSAVIAYRIPPAERELKPTITASSAIDTAKLTDGDRVGSVSLPIGHGGVGWVQFSYSEPQTIRAATLVLEPGLRVGPVLPSWPVGRIEASDDGKAFRTIASLPPRGSPQQTIAFPSTTARHFRLVLEPRFAPLSIGVVTIPPRTVAAHKLMQVEFLSGARIARFEDKAGWSPAPDLDADPTPPVSADAVIATGDVVDLTGRMGRDGALDWTPPPGRWRVVRLGWSLTGKLNNPASPEGTGLEVDKLNRAHVADYAQAYLGAYEQVVGRDMMGARGISHMVTDSYEALAANWTDDILEQFARRRGYNPTPWLPALVGRVVESAVASDRFLWDFRRTLSDLIADSHYGELSRQLHARGMRRYGESHEGMRAFVGDGMEAKKSADIPMGAAWTVFAKRPFQPDLLESGSVAHLYGQNIVAAESFTAMTPAYGFAPEQLKPMADMMMANGVNRFVIHTSVHQPVETPGPGVTLGPFGQWFTRKETWAEMAGGWMNYLARSSHLLQQGRFAADILWFYGEDDNITSLYSDTKPDVPRGFAFDFVNADALRNLLSVKDARITAPSGASYRLLVLDPAARMTLPTLRHVAEMVRAGGIIVGAKPEESPSLADDQAAFAQLAEATWNDTAHVFPTIDAALATIGLEPDADFGAAAPSLAFVHRRLADGNVYFIANPGDAEIATEASLRVVHGTPELWRAEDGQIRPVSYRIEGGRTVIPLSLTPCDAVFIVFRGARAASSLQVQPERIEPVASIDGPWALSFPAGSGAPTAATFSALHSWSEDDAPGIRYFSGVAAYHKAVDLPGSALKEGRLLLDLGDVKSIAQVWVNGKSVGTAWKSPFRLDITDAARPGRNRLDIRVANLWPNRMIGDKQPGATKRFADATYLPYQASSPLLPSGLLGPVQLVRQLRPDKRNGRHGI